MPTPLDRAEAWVRRYRPSLRSSERGTLVSVGDGIVWVAGLPSAAIDALLVFDDGSRALVFDLTPELIGGVLLQATDALTSGIGVRLARRALDIPVGDALLGRMVDPMGAPLDGGPDPQTDARLPLERRSAPLRERDFVRRPLYTGSKIIDTLLPVGRGQRQLIIGDDGLGRTSLAVDAVLQQKDNGVLCVYVLIGQKRSTVVQVSETLKGHGAFDYTVLVVAEASALPGLQHLAPFAGASVAEYWMARGRDVLIVYDDLSTHALNYRALSLLLRRPPGREAYPGDIFSVHARLLERSTCLDAAHGGGSMTALPIVETRQGEIAAYIPTNLISITDGQIYLQRSLFAAGFRPAIDIARSVSRIGADAQHPRIAEESAAIKLAYLRYLDLEVFSRFGARLEPGMEEVLKRGRILREIFKQERLAPLPVHCHMAWLTAFNQGLLDETEPEALPRALERLFAGCRAGAPDLDRDRADWTSAVRSWLTRPPDTDKKPPRP
jgi:F-type H+-transporting ATPase subunit alpha